MRKLLPFILAVLILGFFLCAPLFLTSEKSRVQLADTLSQRLNHKVVIGKMQGSFFPPSIKLQSVSLLNPAGDAPLMQAEKVVAVLSWSQLFRGKLAPGALKFDGWQAFVHRRADGSWAWDEWVGPTAQLGQSSGWPLLRIILDNGECHFIDPFGPGPADFVVRILQGGWESGRQYFSVNGVMTTLPAPVNFVFQGSGRFVTAPEWSAVLELNDENRQWKMDWKVTDNHTETASGHSDQWRIDTAYALVRYYSRLPVPIPAGSASMLLQDWKIQLNWRADALTFTQSAGIAGGRAEATGELLYKPAASTAKLDVAIQDVKLQPIEAAFWGSSPLEATATGLSHFELTLSSRSWGQVSGQGSLALKDGRYLWPQSSVRSLSKAHVMRYLARKYPAFEQNGLAFSKATVRWTARRGIFNFDNAFCDLGTVKMGSAGQYDAAHNGLDVYTRVQVQETDPELLKELPPTYLHKGASRNQIQPMMGRLQGTPEEWYLRTVRGSKIPSDIRTKLTAAMRGK